MAEGRRGFVSRMVGGAAVLGALAVERLEAEGHSLAEPGPDGPDFMATVPKQEKAAWDTSWVDRITGRYRQVFDAPEIAQGTVFHQARTYLQGFTDVYGMKDSDLTAVMVIRHAAIAMVANDRLWDELELGRVSKLKDPETGKPARRNPFLNANTPRGAKYGLLWPDGGLDTLIGRGAVALCCDLALYQIVGMIAKRDQLEMKPAREKALANLVPGVIVQPSGVFAVARAQAAGCQYIRSA